MRNKYIYSKQLLYINRITINVSLYNNNTTKVDK